MISKTILKRLRLIDPRFKRRHPISIEPRRKDRLHYHSPEDRVVFQYESWFIQEWIVTSCGYNDYCLRFDMAFKEVIKKHQRLYDSQPATRHG